jgi:hypothetical protein
MWLFMLLLLLLLLLYQERCIAQQGWQQLTCMIYSIKFRHSVVL